MLHIFFGDMPDVIYNTSVYFKNTYQDNWITSDFGRNIISDVDKSNVISASVIKSPALSCAITPRQLSGGVQTLFLIQFDKKHIFNASTCGDECAKWILKIAENQDVVINLRHLMDFGKGNFRIKVLNTNKIVKNMAELIEQGAEFV